MEEIFKMLNRDKPKQFVEHKFINAVTLAIAFMIKKVNIKRINEDNFQEIFDESELASFWKSIDNLYFKKYSIGNKQQKILFNNAYNLQKFTEQEIADSIIEELDKNETKHDQNGNKFLAQIAEISKTAKTADAFGKTGFFSTFLSKKYGTSVDFYEINPDNNFRAMIRQNIEGEICNIIDCLPGVHKNTKYDFVFANPILDIKSIYLLQGEENKNTEPYENAKILIDDNNIEKYELTKNTSPFYILSLIVISMLKKDGKAIIVLPTNCLINNNNKLIRKYLVNNYLSEIIILPDELYPEIKTYTGDSKMSALIFEKNKTDSEIIFSNLEYCYLPKGEYNELDIDKATQQHSEYSRSISRDAIRRNQFSLDPEIYLNHININNPINLGDIATDIFRGYQFKKEEFIKMKTTAEKEVDYRISKLNNNKYDDIIEINSKGKKLDRYLLKDGDIVLNSRGAENDIILITKSAEDLKLIATGSMIVIRLNDKKIKSKYLELFLKSKRGTFILNKGKNNNAVYVGNLKKIKVSCPPIKLQEEMLSRIEQLEKALTDIKNLM